MTTTVDIPEEVLKRAIAATGARSAEEAVIKAVEECVIRHDQRKIIPFLGTFSDEFCSSDESLESANQNDLIRFLGKLEGFPTQDELRDMRDAE